MSTTPPDERTFDRDQVALILREAAELEPAGAASRSLAASGADDADRDGLTLREIARAASEVGITGAAVRTASLRVALRSAHAHSGRHHQVHEIEGVLTDDGWESLAAELRALTSPGGVRRVSDGLDFELGTSSGEPGSLLVQIRARRGRTVVELWSEAPRSGKGDLVGYAAIGAPMALFPIVAVSAGQWPALGWIAALGGAGAAAGAGLGLALQRWQRDRWRARIERVLLPIVTRTSELSVEGRAESSDG